MRGMEMRGTKARRHEGMKWCERQKGWSEFTSCLHSFFTPSYLRAFVLLCLLPCLLLIIGCTDQKKPTTQPMTNEQQKEAGLNDPMNYKIEDPNYDISGGNITHLDKSALKKDIDHVFS